MPDYKEGWNDGDRTSVLMRDGDPIASITDNRDRWAAFDNTQLNASGTDPFLIGVSQSRQEAKLTVEDWFRKKDGK